MANSGAPPSDSTDSNANPSSFLAYIPDDIILSFVPLLLIGEVVYFLESNFPLSYGCIFYLGESNYDTGVRLAHAAASMNCRIALRRLNGAGCNMTKADDEGWTPLHFAVLPGTSEPFSEEDREDRGSSFEDDVSRQDKSDELEVCKTIYALCLNSHTLRAEGRESANVRLPESFKIAHPLNLETNYPTVDSDYEKETALSIAVKNYRGLICKRLLLDGMYIKLGEIEETKANWKWFLRKLRKWDRFRELKHRRKGWYCMKKSSQTNDVPPWIHWKKRQAKIKKYR